MKVRFSEQAIRCRVAKAELASLLDGRALVLEVGLPRGHVFRMSVRPSPLNQWQLDSDPTGYWLTIPHREIEALRDSLPSREGLQKSFDLWDGGSVQVSFEVDVKDRGD